ncbi:hypothetical protein [Streptomyces sp. NPDC055912]|uniref:hypothetical protein n=1 Tax=unclassified Streptomyces TaxID=2593676 RepID=UPI0035DCF486
MAMLETILATVSALGGAGLGAAGALLVQRTKRRDDTALAESAAHRVEEQLTLEILATARVAARAWLIAVERAINDLQRQQQVDVERYDEQIHMELKEFTSALFRMAARRAPSSWYEGSPVSRPLVDQLSEMSLHIRNVLRSSQPSQVELESTLSRAQTLYQVINELLIVNTEAFTGQPFPTPAAAQAPQ